jgi:drug/metabolite transporter (DMT)-like permease
MTFDKHRLYILIAAFLWGGTGVYFKELSARGMEPMQVVLIRTSFAMIGLGVWLLIKNRKAFRIHLKDFWCFLGTGVASLLFFNWCFFSAINETGMAVAGTLLYTAPAFVTVMSALLFKEKLKLPGWGVLVITILGCMLVSGIVRNEDTINIVGILYGLGAGFGYALYTIFSRYALNKGYSPMTISFYTFTLCALGTIPFIFTITSPNLLHMASDAGTWMYAVALGSAGCLLPYWLYTKGLSGVTGATASMTAALEPVVIALFGVFLYHESLTVWQVLGMILVLGSIIILAKINKPENT